MDLQFLGAATTVTGSQFLLTTSRAKVLIDCGMFQGLKSLRVRNWARLPVHPASVTSVVLTHAHIDHSGLLPRLVANGPQVTAETLKPLDAAEQRTLIGLLSRLT